MQFCIGGLLTFVVSGQVGDEASLLQTIRSRQALAQHTSQSDTPSVICPFLKVLTRYRCIPNAQKLTIEDYEAALQHFGDAGGNYDKTSLIFHSPLAAAGYLDVTKSDNTPIEADPVLTLGLADPVPQKSKYRDLFKDIRSKSRRVGVDTVAALLVKQSADGLVNKSDIQAGAPVGGRDPWGAIFDLFGTSKDKKTAKTMSRLEFKEFVLLGKIPRPLRKKYRSATRCPQFPAGYWKYDTDSPSVVKAREIWATDPASCKMKKPFPKFQCP